MHGQEEIIVQIENMLKENHDEHGVEAYRVSANFVMTIFLKLFHHHRQADEFLEDLKYIIEKRLENTKKIRKTYSSM